ncbi:50S ribosomal protein L32e, partial [archaeon]
MDPAKLARLKRRFKKPKFIRFESWRYKRLETGWRKPKGIDN